MTRRVHLSVDQRLNEPDDFTAVAIHCDGRSFARHCLVPTLAPIVTSVHTLSWSFLFDFDFQVARMDVGLQLVHRRGQSRVNVGMSILPSLFPRFLSQYCAPTNVRFVQYT